MSAYDAAAPSFERHRPLPNGVTEVIRAAILEAIDTSLRPRLLDLGAGTGRFGKVFAATGDNYVGVDLSFGMLRKFSSRAREIGRAPNLVQADGRFLPFGDATFDGIVMIQIFGALRGWRQLLAEAHRVLRPEGRLIIGNTVAPRDGIDARMREHLWFLLREIGVESDQGNVRGAVEGWLEINTIASAPVVVTAWDARRTVRGFLDRHPTGARFFLLPKEVKEEALERLRTWAIESFGSLDAVCLERHHFELRVFKFETAG